MLAVPPLGRIVKVWSGIVTVMSTPARRLAKLITTDPLSVPGAVEPLPYVGDVAATKL